VSGVALSSWLLAALVSFGPLRSTGAVREFPTAAVRRASFDSVIVAPGRLASLNNTEVTCTLERVATSSTATILWLIDDGSSVKKGDVICELDSAGYRELVRTQDIKVEQARAAYQQAKLDLEVAGIDLRAFLEGELSQTDKLYRGQIALARSDLTRQKDRVSWTKRMLEKGYASTAQVSTEELNLRKVSLTLAQTERAFANYQRFSTPKTRRALESIIVGAKASLDFETIKLRHEEERLALYKSMVERCTIRAPHDGLVIYSNRSGRAPEVFEGAMVRQRQRLFAIPDLSRMVVEVMLHETVVERVQVGMPARVRVEALPGRSLTGRVISVAPLPLNERKQETQTDVTYFVGRVELDTLVDGLRPGMTAELEILAARRQEVLSVPSEAVFLEGEQPVCYVVHEDRLERRPITVGYASHDLKEVTKGLAPGEEVVLQPPPTLAATLSRPKPSAGRKWDINGEDAPRVVEARAPRRGGRPDGGAFGKGGGGVGKGRAKGAGKRQRPDPQGDGTGPSL
jgi:HlyD family secretion protein